MTTTIQEDGNQVIAFFSGRLDTTAAVEATATVKPLMDVREKEIVLDCSKLEYISSSGLRIFLSIRKEAIVHGCKVIVRNMNTDIRQVFMMTGFISLFDIQE
ncbi:MAG: STAS domain-containing protein [Bacteroidaceae bacterium]|nr:STAS domain-containing protein [Bacteroidaceae bacterium]MBQ8454051.1 STAS domain-containing protein [Bacteroidaceae bacterium]MBQ9171110.1 STAS domain-containing protein [Bacteroidaceae bacterium]MBQ9293799.1 STAS domain-containing protein [Bacteroidaceae bacterium]